MPHAVRQMIPHEGVNLLIAFNENSAATYRPLPGVPSYPYGHAFVSRVYLSSEQGRELSFEEADREYRRLLVAGVRAGPGWRSGHV